MESNINYITKRKSGIYKVLDTCKDEKNNAVIGENVMLYDATNCVVKNPTNKLIVAQGLEDYIVVESDDALLICKKKDEQQIRQFVNDVKLQKGNDFI